MSPSVRYLGSQDRLHAILGYPDIYRLGAALHETNEVGRPPAHHTYELLLFAAMGRATRSLIRTETDLRATGVWTAVRAQMTDTIRRYGLDLPEPAHAPPATHHWARYRDRHLGSDDGIAALQRTYLDLAVDLAHAVGLLRPGIGSFTHPQRVHTIYGDGTIVRPMYAGRVPTGGTEPGAASGRIDPGIAEHHGHTGPVNGHGYVAFHARGPSAYQRVTLLIEHIPAPGQEAATATAMVQELARVIGDGARAVVYDGAMHGVHIDTIMRRDGYLVIAPMSTLDGSSDPSVTQMVKSGAGTRLPSKPLGTIYHDTPAGRCGHTLITLNGRPATVVLDDSGDPALEQILERGAVKRARRAGGEYHFNVQYRVPCPRGSFSIWLSPHATESDPARPNDLRIITQGDEDHAAIAGIRSDTESSHAQYKRTLMVHRAMSLGWRSGLLDYYAFALYSNAMTHWTLLQQQRDEARHLRVVR